MNVGGDAKQFVRLPNGTTIVPGTGYGTLTQTGARTPFDYFCSANEAPYAYSRGWDNSTVSFDVKGAAGDVQHFADWTNVYDMQAGVDDECGRKMGYRLTSWAYPYGATVTLDYGAAFDPFDISEPHLERLVDIRNNIGRQIDMVYDPADPKHMLGFTNHLTGSDLRQVTLNDDGSMTDPSGAVTTFPGGDPTTLKRPLAWGLLTQVATASNPAQTDVEFDYDGLGRVSAVKDAMALNGGTRAPYTFYIADGTRGERDDPLGQAYTVGYDTYGHPSSYVDEMGLETDAVFDSRGRAVSHTYPEGDCEVFGYDDRNNTTDRWKVDRVSGCNTGAGATHVLHASVAWDPAWKTEKRAS